MLPTSPLIDAGDPATINEMGLDGSTPLQADIGAFETELVMTSPGDAFQESNGQVVMEAEHATWNIRRSKELWLEQRNLSGYAGSGYLSAFPDTGVLFDPAFAPTGSELQYTVNFTTTGVYTVWLRGYASDGAGDSVYIGLVGQNTVTPSIMTGFAPGKWTWINNSVRNGVATIEITEPGLHTLQLWFREDGLRLDRILLTTDNSYNPSGSGPPESE